MWRVRLNPASTRCQAPGPSPHPSQTVSPAAWPPTCPLSLHALSHGLLHADVTWPGAPRRRHVAFGWLLPPCGCPLPWSQTGRARAPLGCRTPPTPSPSGPGPHPAPHTPRCRGLSSQPALASRCHAFPSVSSMGRWLSGLRGHICSPEWPWYPVRRPEHGAGSRSECRSRSFRQPWPGTHASLACHCPLRTES